MNRFLTTKRQKATKVSNNSAFKLRALRDLGGEMRFYFVGCGLAAALGSPPRQARSRVPAGESPRRSRAARLPVIHSRPARRQARAPPGAQADSRILRRRRSRP